ncbi:hypothetical protein ACHWQZ_G008113 [Mnemiopsis leidyi]
MLKNGQRAVKQVLSGFQARQIQTTCPNFEKKKAGKRGYWFKGKKKGTVQKPYRDVINGVQLPWETPFLRFSYLGQHKYEWDRTEPVRPWDRPELPKPHFGQYSRTAGDTINYTENCGYRVKVRDSSLVVEEDKQRTENHEMIFGDRSLERRVERRLAPYPSSFVDPLVWRFIEKIKLCKFTGVDRAFDIMVETMKLIKLHQMQLKKANPDKEIELDSNTILRKAVMNVSPPLRIDFVQVQKKRDGYKPCPVPLTVEESTNLAIKRFKIQSKRRKRRTPVEPMRLANLIIDSYNKRGVLREAVLEDAQLGEKYQDMYQRFGRVTYSHTTKKRLPYRQQTHLDEIMHVTLPLENDEYSKLPGQPEFHDDDLLDEEDKRDKPLRAGIGDFPSS